MKPFKNFETIPEEEMDINESESEDELTPRGNMADASHESDNDTIEDGISINGEVGESIHNSNDDSSDSESGEEKKTNNDVDFSDKKTPFALLEGLFKGLPIEYKHSSNIKNKTPSFTCEVVISGEIKGSAKYYNKKMSKHLAAVDALKKCGVNFELCDVEECEIVKGDDLDDTISQTSTKSVRFEQKVSIVKFDDYLKLNTIEMKPLNPDGEGEDEKMSIALSICGSELDRLDDVNEPTARNHENRLRNMAFLWCDFNQKKKKATRPLGSNIIENPIGFINERCLKNGIPLPIYTMMSVPDGKKIIHQAKISMCDYNFSAYGKSKKDAKFSAAKKLIVYAAKMYQRRRRQINQQLQNIEQ